MNILIGILFEGKAKSMADATDIGYSSISRWRNGKATSSDELIKLYVHGISLDWLFDTENYDIADMFARNDAGNKLRSRMPAAMQYTSQERVMMVNEKSQIISATVNKLE
ncbi:MAG: helix-turn-helix transcriptional regulator [Candidatus Kapabacteria bacterium]|nr:helix-turn-helix transcriptional regulator [Candidatus Kapabacteria bacterium]